MTRPTTQGKEICPRSSSSLARSSCSLTLHLFFHRDQCSCFKDVSKIFCLIFCACCVVCFCSSQLSNNFDYNFDHSLAHTDVLNTQQHLRLGLFGEWQMRMGVWVINQKHLFHSLVLLRCHIALHLEGYPCEHLFGSRAYCIMEAMAIL